MKVFLALGSEILLQSESKPTTTNQAETSVATEMPGRVWDPRKGRDVGPAVTFHPTSQARTLKPLEARH